MATRSRTGKRKPHVWRFICKTSLVQRTRLNDFYLICFALVQSMTDSCSYFSMWRVFDTLSSRGFAIPTLRSRWSLSMGLLRFSLFEAAKKSVFYQTRAICFYGSIFRGKIRLYSRSRKKILQQAMKNKRI